MNEALDLNAMERANLGKVVRPEDWMALLAYARGLEARVRELESRANDYCTEGKYCVCGGDLPSIREGCGNWRKGE